MPSKEAALRLAVLVLLLLSPLLPSSDVIQTSASADDLSEKGACPGGYVALTFDDGPSPDTTLAITHELRARQGRGTFFLIGNLAAEYPEIVQQIRVAGMEVGNHTLDHPFLDQLDASQVRDELAKTSDMITGLAGPPPTLFRPPYGRTNDTIRAIAKQMHMTEVLWTYDSDDYAEATVPRMLAQAAKAKNGDILLFHDGYQSTVDAIPKILNNLSSRGICSGRIVPTKVRQQAWLDYTGDDRTYYYAKAARW
jgi:peptidoglycan/xylan/chitin deacetylase (PgdA/CDA1 family)